MAKTTDPQRILVDDPGLPQRRIPEDWLSESKWPELPIEYGVDFGRGPDHGVVATLSHEDDKLHILKSKPGINRNSLRRCLVDLEHLVDEVLAGARKRLRKRAVRARRQARIRRRGWS